MSAGFAFFGAPIELTDVVGSPEKQAGPGTLQQVGRNTGSELGALLSVNTAAGSPPGGLQADGMLGLVALTEFAPAPGVRGWELEVAPGFMPIPHLMASGFVNNGPAFLVGGVQLRFAGVGPFPPGYVHVWLVDATEAPIDPANAMGFGGNGNFASFLVTAAGILQRPT